MRHSRASAAWTGVILAVLAGLAGGSAHAQVRVLDFRSLAGQKIPMHSHPAYISYSISGSGKTKFTSADGKTTEQPNSPAGATWHEAETHASEYMGPGATHVLLVELKGK
jgi:hypothetical protein